MSSAQGQLYTPANGTEVEGSSSTFIFGWSPSQGHRFMDFSHTGPARSIKGVSFRLDGASQVAIGRTWSKVTIRMAHGDWNSIQYNRSNAYRLVDTPVTVFDKAWSFPALNGKPPLDPAAWGGVRSSLQFRFSQPWQYNGKDAIFFEFVFSGGVADGNRTWPDTSSEFEYKLDSMPESAWRGAGGGKQSYPDDKSSGCVDSAFDFPTKKVPAYLDANLSGSSDITLSIDAYYTAPNTPLLLALGLAGVPQGGDVGVGCNRFYPDLLTPLAILVLPAPSSKYVSSAKITAPRQTSWKDFWMQAIWFDSKDSSLKLSNAMRVSTSQSGIIPAATSYVAGGTNYNVWTSSEKGMPFIRYDL